MDAECEVRIGNELGSSLLVYRGDRETCEKIHNMIQRRAQDEVDEITRLIISDLESAIAVPGGTYGR